MPPPIGGYVLGSEEWRTEYRDRVGKTMDLLRSPDNDRLVMWVGQPIMGPQSGVEHLDQINYIYASEAKKRPWVQYFDAFPFFSDADGAYAKALANADGAEHVMRANDNIHLSTFGANRLGVGGDGPARHGGRPLAEPGRPRSGPDGAARGDRADRDPAGRRARRRTRSHRGAAHPGEPHARSLRRRGASDRSGSTRSIEPVPPSPISSEPSGASTWRARR